MSIFEHLPDDAAGLTPARVRSMFTSVSRDPTLVGWIGRYALLALALGGCAVGGSLLVPVLYAYLG